MSETYLPEGMPIPVAQADGLDKPHWDGLQDGKLLIQKCGDCGTWQWGPEWICHQCLSFDLDWQAVPATNGALAGLIYSWERSHHPVHPALKEAGPYLAVLVELPSAGNVRMLGNLLGDSMQEVKIGMAVERSGVEAGFDSFVMSCRAMGFGLEQLVLHLVIGAERDAKRFIGRFVPTDRNTPASTLYADGGFASSGETEWVLERPAPGPEPPGWIRVRERR